MVVMDDRIISARENRKLYPRTGGFSGGEMGDARHRGGNGPEFFFKPLRKHGVDTEFDVTALTTLPKVELVSRTPAARVPGWAMAREGLVAATTGFSPSERDAFTEIRRKGVVIVQAFPSGEHVAGGHRRTSRRPAPGPQGDAFAGQNAATAAADGGGAAPAAAEGAHPADAGADADQGSARDSAHLQRVLNPGMARGSTDIVRLAAGVGAVAARRGRVRAVARRLERRHGLDHLPADRPAGRRHLAAVGGRRHLGRGDALLQLLLPAAGRHLDDCRSAELGRAVRVPGRQPGGQQPFGGGARADAGSRRTPGRTGAPVRPEPRRAGHDRQPRGDLDAGAVDRPPLRSGIRRDRPAARERVGGLRSRAVSIAMDTAPAVDAHLPPPRPRSSSTPTPGPTPVTARWTIDGRTIRLVPLRVGTKPIGLLAAAGRPIEAGTLDALGGVVAIAIERAQFLEERKAGRADAPERGTEDHAAGVAGSRSADAAHGDSRRREQHPSRPR